LNGFADFLDEAFGRLRRYAAADMIVGLNFRRVLGEDCRGLPAGRSAAVA
jgi:hypothetical protein